MFVSPITSTINRTTHSIISSSFFNSINSMSLQEQYAFYLSSV